MVARARYGRLAPLQAGIALALSLAHRHPASATPGVATHFVSSCVDDGAAGTLRFEVANAASGDSIDVAAQLPPGCTEILLTSAIEFAQDSLTIMGPGADSLAVNSGHAYRVFMHLGAGTFAVSGLTVKNGYYANALGSGSGACIFSGGDVSLDKTTVSGCDVHALHTGSTARGAGVFAAGNLTLIESKITGSNARGWYSLGGGAYARGLLDIRDSEIVHNTSTSTPGFYARGGGIEAAGDVTISGSTIADNTSEAAAGLDISGGPFHSASLTNTTISSNAATDVLGGIWSNVNLTIQNSTIAFNRSLQPPVSTSADGVFSLGAPIRLRSSIVAGNRGANGPSDIGGQNGALITLSSANNLVIASSLDLPANTLQACPQLDMLRHNGGNTRTHALLHVSPAIDQGSNPTNVPFDQRGANRLFGVATDIGSVEWKATDVDERILSSGFDGACDQ